MSIGVGEYTARTDRLCHDDGADEKRRLDYRFEQLGAIFEEITKDQAFMTVPQESRPSKLRPGSRNSHHHFGPRPGSNWRSLRSTWDGGAGPWNEPSRMISSSPARPFPGRASFTGGVFMPHAIPETKSGPRAGSDRRERWKQIAEVQAPCPGLNPGDH
ncbi:hypothetical protein CSOJ01_05352 [Colletotrichum sojae]|uniref:Uncharacterized protein n=1 Tax=Colletotrichum sojae TaxID=2175907 RepID=A0A8H6MXP7_9PEZI|nr:hypothetical protein CSOJ01_05352 [Colletotrichum sojae]